jgi:ABC-2 type transport system ATP-binding protein
MSDAVVVERLTKAFGGFVAVDDVSFAVGKGEIFGFLGPNGAGKTTTIRMLLGLLRPTSGRATVLGLDVARDARELHARVGYMSQLFTLYNDLTAWENIRFYGQAYGLSRRQLDVRSDQILGMAGLQGRESSLTSTLAGGWRQRLALGCAIIHQPSLVFLDEPTAGVDPISRRDFWELIYQLAEEGTTVFVTTHYMDEAEHCQRLGFISGGRLTALGPPEELKRTIMAGRSVVEINASHPEEAMLILQGALDRLGLTDLSFYGASLHAVVADPGQAIPRVRDLLEASSIGLESVSSIDPSLEDVFIASVKGGIRPSSPA